MYSLKVKIKDYIQPFEKKLAEMELTKLTGSSVKVDENDGMFLVSTDRTPEFIAEKLAYFEYVKYNKKIYYTDQLRVESTTLSSKNHSKDTQLYLDFYERMPRRRCLRYGPHGIHEYRGKFFPQLVKSLINISGIDEKGIVGDPMAGSGTTLVESVISGHQCMGMDMNPLSVFISKTKIDVLKLDPEELEQNCLKICEQIKINSGSKGYLQNLNEIDQKYLGNWFLPPILRKIDALMIGIGCIDNSIIKNLAIVSLSNILREMSQQKVTDLRIRKDCKELDGRDPLNRFCEELSKSVNSILLFLRENKNFKSISYDIFNADARNCEKVFGTNSIDLVITSPPYANALPYLDTDRLSLYLLGLLSRKNHKNLDISMIGNREISEKIRKSYIEQFYAEKHFLPEIISSLISKIDKLNTNEGVGFRRKNMSALLFKYFSDMKCVLQSLYSSLRSGGQIYMVVGDNRTVAGNETININTSFMIEALADMLGFSVKENISMEMLISRDIFKNNSVRTERILHFAK